jgi:eukaryotic-like serine/threonine-protein kinase
VTSASKLDRYRYISDLGRGGMSHVVLAQDILLGRRVALKRMNAGDDTRALLRLRREALIGASVSHPNLVSIYDIVAAGGGEYVIVMEYVEGETLRQALAGGRRLPVGRVLAILDGVAAALDAIHEQKIVHRDVKPANILLATSGEVKLADLGIASAPDRTRITMEGSILGTLSYIAPEQLQGHAVSPASDIYSLAAVAYEALAGRKAHPESNALALVHAISTRPPPDLRAAWPEAPPAAAQLLVRAMAPDPAKRPKTASELTRSLRQALEDATTLALRAPPRPLPTAGSRTRPPATRQARGEPVPAPQARREPPAARQGREAIGGPTRRHPQPASTPEQTSSRRNWRGLIPVLLLGLLVIGAIAMVLANQGTSRRAQSTAQQTRAHRASISAARANGTTAAKSKSTAASSPAATPATGPAAAAPAPSTTPPAAATPPAAPTTSASNPISAAEAFYTLAAAHRYAQAWALADPAFRDQLGGYSSFEYGQSMDRSITFDSARVISETTDAAVLAVRTTSVRTNGTQHCSGTIDMRRVGSTWLIHHIDINCV